MRLWLILGSILGLSACIQTGGGNNPDGGSEIYEICGGGDEDEDGLINETDRRDPQQGPCNGTYDNGCPVGYYNCINGKISGCQQAPEGENCEPINRADAGIPLDAGTKDAGLDAGADAGPDGGTNPTCIQQAQANCTSENTCACRIHEMLKCLGYPAGYGTLCEGSSQAKHYLCQASCPASSSNLGSGFSDGCGGWSCCLVGLACQPPAGSCSDATCSN